MSRNILLACASSVMILGATTAYAQRQVTIGSPFNITNNSFFEQNGVNFNFTSRGSVPLNGRSATVGLGQFQALTPGPNFQQNNAALPPFGGGIGNQPATLGFQVGGRNGTASFGLFAGQGSNSSIVSQTPSVTVMDGQTGILSDTSQRPFVTGLVPVVGENVFGGISLPKELSPGGQFYKSMLEERLSRLSDGINSPSIQSKPALPAANVNQPAAGNVGNAPAASDPPAKGDAVDPISTKLGKARDSSAGQPAPSVDDIRRARDANNLALQNEVRIYMDKARAAEDTGKFGMAKIYYDMAAAKADGELKLRATAASRAMAAQIGKPREEAAPVNAAKPAFKSGIGNDKAPTDLGVGRPISEFKQPPKGIGSGIAPANGTNPKPPLKSGIGVGN